MTEIKCLLPHELRAALVEMGEPAFRAGQIFKWLHEGVETFDEMSNLPKALRVRLSEQFMLTVPRVVKRQCSKLDGTRKYLWQLHDGACVEAVLMQYEHGNTVCISTQVGCRMACTFCASGLNGLARHLSAGEMLDEVLFMQKDSGQKISNIVLMGTGEPLDNYDNVVRFLRLVSVEGGIHIGQRHISVSTSGLAQRIEQLADEGLQITLSVSLHAPDDKTRSSIMPVNRAYSVERLMQACHTYFDRTGRRISFEYMMAKGKTDRPWQAERLANLLRGRPSHVNLIPLNEVAESPLHPSDQNTVRRFQQQLARRGVTATVRRRLGPDIDAACGQLRQRTLTNNSTKGDEIDG